MNFTFAHCRCKNTAENFWLPCDTDAVPNFFSTRPLSGFPCVESLGISNCMCGISADLMLARFRVRERKYVSVRFVLRISEVRFFWLVKIRLTSVQLKTLNSLLCFSQVQNWWCWLSLILSSSAKKETQSKLVSSSVVARDLFCSRQIGVRLSRTVSSSAHWKLVSYGLRRH